MKERPILFNSEMVRAVLDGRKTQTRRVIKPKAVPLIEAVINANGKFVWDTFDYDLRPLCPYGQPGDELWVRERLFFEQEEGWCYHADGLPLPDPKTDDEESWMMSYHGRGGSNCQSIHMPRHASRIQLLIKDIRVERVQDITEEDSLADGGWKYGNCPIHKSPQKSFQKLWDSINEKRGFGWEVNPFCWVVEFEVKK